MIKLAELHNAVLNSKFTSFRLKTIGKETRIYAEISARSLPDKAFFVFPVEGVEVIA